MRISDWSSDVCSSDLQLLQGAPRLMVKAIRIHEPGGPEVLRYEDVAVPAPGPGEVLLQQKACGLNYIDLSHRMGTYPIKYQIGRASVRERESPDGKVLGVAGS